MSDRAWKAVWSLLAIVLLAGVTLPALLRDRTITSSTPTSRPLSELTTVPVAPGGRVCVAGFGVDTDAEALQIAAAGGRAPLPPVAVTVRAAGWAASGALPEGWRADVGVPVVLSSPPPRELDDAQACVANRGRRTLELLGTAEPRARADVRVTRDGATLSGAQPWIALVRDERSSVLRTLGDVLDRATTMSPVPAPVAWLVALLLVLAAPGALAWALWSATRDDDA